MQVPVTKTPSRGGWASIIKLQNGHYNIDAAIEIVIAELYGAGIILRDSGNWTRFAVPGKGKSNRAGFCKALSHEIAVVGRFDTDERHLIILDDKEKTIDELPQRRRIEQARWQAEQTALERQARIERVRTEQAVKAHMEWSKASMAYPGHCYLRTKGIVPMGLRQTGARLLVPMVDGKIIVNLQSIYPNGAKRFMSGARKKGCYFTLGAIKDSDPLLICEGVATGITLHMTTGYAVACAMDCGNLLPVAKNLRVRYSVTPILVCADNDHRTKGNPGITAGKAAAAAVGGCCIWPEFPEEAEGTDFNDLAAMGREVVL